MEGKSELQTNETEVDRSQVLARFILESVKATGSAKLSSRNIATMLQTRSSLVYSNWCRAVCNTHGLEWDEDFDRGIILFQKSKY